ncbi:type VI secretion system baseplate subunit TssG [Novosphingobium aquimarinum]|uniref:type VI secretion system baseplate subunit TssG n=1 Tax=Novosphingobium aquimarinum TaxID=2682494 RepID=UPI001E4A76BA|nr:type VI secretion system baseplate subunit TssG [Novosphingobium aquimarinum]
MASPDRPSQEHLNYLRAMAEDVRGFGLFPVVRTAEAMASDLPRVGTSSGKSRDILKLSQYPSQSFPAPTIEQIAFGESQPDIQGHWLGLLGPMGPLPSHLTEFAIYERRYAEQRPFGAWLDLISNRMLQLFYRAWADSQPAASADRPGDDPFAWFIALLCGALDATSDKHALPAPARLQYAALLASPRSAVAIEDALSHLLEQQVSIEEFQSHWYPIERADQSRLGKAYCSLGHDTIIGKRISTSSEAFQVVIRAGSLADYRSLMPSGPRFPMARDALNTFSPSHLTWVLLVELDGALISPARADGTAQLGWTSWLGKGTPGEIRRDVRLRKAPRRAKQS